MDRPYRTLIVDDSEGHRRLIRDIISRYPAFEVVAEATNGGEAIKEVILREPDLITLDLEMPGMDGFTFLRWLMYAKPTRTVVVSSRESNRSVFKALDFVVKPVRDVSNRLLEMERELVFKLTAAAGVDMEKVLRRMERPQRKGRLARSEGGGWRAELRGVLVAASTGGPPAVQSFVQGLPEDFPLPVFVNQHMPTGFTDLFAKRLSGLTRLSVREAAEGDVFSRGIYVAPGGHHSLLTRSGGETRVRIVPTSPDDRYTPAADRLFLSAVDQVGSGLIAVVLTGMGDDGTAGCAAVKKAGGTVIAEDESTCVVYGMPKAVAERGLADRILPLPAIAGAVVDLCRAPGGEADN
jgi:two-component system chemotaxis response regulator CheB